MVHFPDRMCLTAGRYGTNSPGRDLDGQLAMVSKFFS